MKSRPILFSTPMVRALLDGSKTQTRRIMKPQPIADRKFSGGNFIPPTKRTKGSQISVEAPYVHLACPYGQPGDQLWVRETWGLHTYGDETDWHKGGCTSLDLDDKVIAYRADWGPLQDDCHWRPSIHMFRAASRITLEVTRVRVERLHACNEVDAIAEGAPWAACGSPQEGSHKAGYAQLWESINGPGSWDMNPWVWVIEFKVVKP